MTGNTSFITRFGLVLLAVMVLATVGACQGTPENRPNRRGGETQIDFLTEQLDLTGDQVVKIRDILNETAEQARKDRTLYNGSDSARNEMAKIRDESMHEQIKAVLTEEQKIKYDTIKDRIPRPGRWVGPGNLDQRLQDLTDRLSLSDEQAAQVEEILAEMQPELDQLREEMQKNRGDREAMRPNMQKMRAVRDEIDERIEGDR